jgi:hypothetical protein
VNRLEDRDVDSHANIHLVSVMQAFAESLLSAPRALMRPTQAKRCDLLHIRHISTGAVHSNMSKSRCVTPKSHSNCPTGKSVQKSVQTFGQKFSA